MSAQKRAHQFASAGQEKVCLCSVCFVEELGAVAAFLVAAVEKERNRVGCVCLACDGRGVVGQDQHAKILACGAELIGDALCHAVDLFNGVNFFLDVAVVTALVGCLHVHIYKVVSVQQCLDCGVCLAAEVGVPVSRCAIDFDDFKSCKDADPFDEINCRNDGAALAIELKKRAQERFCAFSPEPYGVGGILACRFAGKVDGMIF